MGKKLRTGGIFSPSFKKVSPFGTTYLVLFPFDLLMSFSQQCRSIFRELMKFCQTSHQRSLGFSSGSDGKVSVYNVGDPGSIPGLGRSLGEGNGNLLQYYCLENPMDRGAWQATVHGVAKSWTRLSDFTI